jgi:hypothetical protein
MEPEFVPPRRSQGTCCALMKPSPAFSLRIGGMPLPDFPITLEKLSSYVKSLLDKKNSQGELKYKIMGKRPDPDAEPMTLRTPEHVDKILNAGGEINICEVIRPLIG